MVKDENYWRKDVNLPDEVTVVPVTEEATALSALKTGVIDYLDNVSPKYVAELESGSTPDIKLVMPHPGSATYNWTLLKNTAPPFNNRDMRMAVSYAIDREALLRTVYFGKGEAHWNIFPKGHWCYAVDSRVRPSASTRPRSTWRPPSTEARRSSSK